MGFIRSICSFASGVLGIYSTVIFIRIIFSWIVMAKNRGGWSVSYGEDQGGSAIDNVDMILGKICDPYLNIFRNVKSLRRPNVDLTPFLALVILNLVRSILGLFARSVSLTVWDILAIFVQGLWESFFSFLLILLLVILIIRFFVGRNRSDAANSFINIIDPILDGPVGRVYKLFYRRKGSVEDQKLVITSIIFYAVLYFALKWGVHALVNFLMSL